MVYVTSYLVKLFIQPILDTSSTAGSSQRQLERKLRTSSSVLTNKFSGR